MRIQSPWSWAVTRKGSPGNSGLNNKVKSLLCPPPCIDYSFRLSGKNENVSFLPFQLVIINMHFLEETALCLLSLFLYCTFGLVISVKRPGWKDSGCFIFSFPSSSSSPPLLPRPVKRQWKSKTSVLNHCGSAVTYLYFVLMF